jgi:hypothetical protein
VRFTPLVLASDWLEAPSYFFTGNELHWKRINFSGAVTYSHKQTRCLPAATCSAAPLLFTHMAYMAAHRLSLSANPNAR